MSQKKGKNATTSTFKSQPTRSNQQNKIVRPAKVFQEQFMPLAEAPKSLKEDLFIRKLKMCSITYNFLDTSKMKEKQIKFSTLKELVTFVSQEGNVSILKEPAYHQIVMTVSDNIFRTFPPSEYEEFEPEYDEEEQEAAWPHLKLVYDLLLHFINSQEVNMVNLRKAITRSFITQLLEIFRSEDARERKSLKNTLLSIYLKLFEQRAFIRKQMRNVFLKHVYETEQFYGIAELLEILSMAINGFNVPLRQEHKDFLLKVLIPLHKPRYIVSYHRCLVECVKGFIRKDQSLAEDTVLGILKFWPKTCSEKEVLFIHEIVELLEFIPNEEFVKIKTPLMKQISASISSLHFQVAETALNLWQNSDFLRHFSKNMKSMMSLVFADLLQVSRSHWNSNIADMAKALLETFKEVDPVLYKSLVSSTKQKAKEKKGNKK